MKKKKPNTPSAPVPDPNADTIEESAAAETNTAAETSSAASGHLQNCLIFLSRHFDLHVSEGAIQAGLVGEDAELSIDQFSQAAERAGIASAQIDLPLDEINDNDLPMVLLKNDGKALVLIERLQSGDFSVHDPDFGDKEVKVDPAELIDSYNGEAVLVRPIVVTSETESERKLSDIRHWFWTPFRDNKKIYIQVAIAAVMTNIFGLATSLFIMVVYDRVVPNNATESLIALTIGIGVVIIFDFIIKSIRAAFVDYAGMRADLAMGQRIFNQILDMQMSSRKGSTGALANMMREFETLRDFITSASIMAVVDLPFIFLFIWVISLVGGPLAMIPSIVVPLVIVVGLVIQPLLAHLAKDAFGQSQQKQGVMVETISGLETIKSIGAAPMMRKRWQDALASSAEYGSKSRGVTQFAMNFTAMAQQSTQVLIVFYGVFLVAEGKVTMGAIIASVILVGRVVGPLAQLAQTMTRINQVKMSYNAIDQFMKSPTERSEGQQYVARPTLEGKIEFRNVTFKYPDQVGNALENVSFIINSGERVAVLGRIGSGKSTLAKLVLGLYEPEQGAIFIDGTDIRQIDPADLRRNIGYTQQDVFLFS
ncbi:MAG: ATP-binding cassette domain-containing protein, partial [Rhodospirillaceae bacterium]|nr:ATP-binding cassette domain-containing protein [Rhodospirillaceae bacterium]